MNALTCEWDKAYLLIFSDNVFAPLIYYSHIGPIIVSLLIGLFVIFNNPRALVNRVLFAITLFFSIWVYFDLILWGSEKIDLVMFFWAALAPIELLIYASTLYLIYLFAHEQRDTSFQSKVAVAIFFVPIILFTHTPLNLLGFDFTNCDREPIEGPLWQYIYIVEFLFIIWAVFVAVRGYRRIADINARRQLVFVSLGSILMMSLFSAGNFIVTYFLEVDWSFEQYKLIGMPIFVAFLAYSIVRFNAFKVKMLSAQVLVAALSVSVISLLFLRTLENVRIVAAITAIFVLVIGYILVRSVSREVKQREEIEKLAVNLANANERLKELDQMKSEFLSVATHQLRAPLTAMRGYASLIAEGNYGEVREEFKDPLFKILESGRNMANSIEDYLNVSRIEQGRMKFESGKFDISALAKTVVDELSPVAAQKKLSLTLKPCGPLEVTGDVGKIKQVMTNYIDNAIKYSPTGTIDVTVEKVGGNARVTVSDTGTGIAADEIPKLFSKFTRARDANKVNTTGTGLGLYVVRQLVEGHKGKAWAESDGLGKGSRFIFEIPA